MVALTSERIVISFVVEEAVPLTLVDRIASRHKMGCLSMRIILTIAPMIDISCMTNIVKCFCLQVGHRDQGSFKCGWNEKQEIGSI